MELKDLPHRAKLKLKENKRYFARLKQKPPKQLDDVMVQLHQEAFEQIDCLKCANCCKTTSPVFTQKDIERIASYLRMRPSQLVEKYLRVDEDHDYVLQSSPCAFLGSDNYCSIYAIRPVACQGYPHTDRKKFHQLLDLTLKNTAICPAAFHIVEKLKITFPV
ncbi:MAG: YkgJ family cysteine cluster protein [Chitinophagales bacterium]|nr:YkgJ family cysteine cluster protein [Chitinophagales bacterium]